MAQILSLDLATVCGWAAGDPGGPVEHGSYRIKAGSDGAFFSDFRQWLHRRVAEYEPRLIVYEAPLITSTKTGFHTAFRLMGLAAHTVQIADMCVGVKRCEPANNATVKKFATGRGRKVEKLDMMWAMRQRGFDPVDHNASDALAIFLWAEATWAPGIRRSAGPLFGGEAA